VANRCRYVRLKERLSCAICPYRSLSPFNTQRLHLRRRREPAMVAQLKIVGDWRPGLYLHYILYILKRTEMDSKDTTNQQEIQKAQMAQINKALAVFLLFFSAVIIAAVFFTETLVGKMTNLAAGLILGLIGLIFIVQTKRSRKKS